MKSALRIVSAKTAQPNSGATIHKFTSASNLYAGARAEFSPEHQRFARSMIRNDGSTLIASPAPFKPSRIRNWLGAILAWVRG